MKKLYLAVLISLAAFNEVSAQQEPHYTQYMYNMNIINPAYAGSKEGPSFGLLYRKQWVNLDGAPSTFSFSGSTPLEKNVGVGLSVVSDKVGPVSEQNATADVSYTLNLNEESKLAFGLKTGVTFQRVGLFSDIASSLPDPSDIAFLQDTNSTYLNLGAGVFYYTNKYYVAFSVPNMIKSTHLDMNGAKYGQEQIHYYLTGGYVFDINPDLKFKPFTMLNSSLGAPLSVDLNANFLFQEKYEAGLSYRLGDSVGLLLNYAINPTIRIGYAYDYTLSSLNATTTSSHEFILLYDLNLQKKVSRSPRYF